MSTSSDSKPVRRSEDDDDAEESALHHVDVRDIRAVANDLYLPISTLVSSMVQEAQRQHSLEQQQQQQVLLQQYQHSLAVAVVEEGDNSPRESNAPRAASSSSGGVEAASLLQANPRQSTASGTPMRSIRVSLANLTSALDDDHEDDSDVQEGHVMVGSHGSADGQNVLHEGTEGREKGDDDVVGADHGSAREHDGLIDRGNSLREGKSASHPPQHQHGAHGALTSSYRSMDSGLGKLRSSTTGRQSPASKAASVAVGSVAGGADSEGDKKSGRFVSFSSEIQRVHVYEVDNSLFIRIEYSRPLLGWIFLLLAMSCGTVVDVLNAAVLANGTSQLLPTVNWSVVGKLILLCGVLLPSWYWLVRPTKAERVFLRSRNGLILVLVVGVLGALIRISEMSNAKLIGQWRSMALSAVHPPLIVLFGKVFRNTVFLEEAFGSAMFLLCFLIAMLPLDVQTANWEFGEILSLSTGIYIASFLFLAVKARASRVSVPVVAASVSVIHFLTMVVVLVATGTPALAAASSAGSSASPADDGGGGGAFGFFSSDSATERFIVSSFASATSLLAYLLTLRFIPPLTVSVALCLQSLVSQFASYLLVFNDATAPWPACPVPPPFSHFMTQTPAPLSLEQQMFCGSAASTGSARNVLFTAGSCLAVATGGYLVYVSSIKRYKVDRLLKHLNSRRVPKNPYQSRSAGAYSAASEAAPLFRGGGYGGGHRTPTTIFQPRVPPLGIERQCARLVLTPTVDRRGASSFTLRGGRHERTGSGSSVSDSTSASSSSTHHREADKYSLDTFGPPTPTMVPAAAVPVAIPLMQRDGDGHDLPSLRGDSWRSSGGGAAGFPVVVLHGLTPPRGRPRMAAAEESAVSQDIRNRPLGGTNSPSTDAIDEYYDTS